MKSSFMMDGQPSVIPEEQEYSDEPRHPPKKVTL